MEEGSSLETARHPQACRKTDSLARVRQRARTPPAAHTDPRGLGRLRGTCLREQLQPPGSEPAGRCRSLRTKAGDAQLRVPGRPPLGGHAGPGGELGLGAPRTQPQSGPLSPFSFSTWAAWPQGGGATWGQPSPDTRLDLGSVTQISPHWAGTFWGAPCGAMGEGTITGSCPFSPLVSMPPPPNPTRSL